MRFIRTNSAYIWYDVKSMMYTYEDETNNFCDWYLTEAEAEQACVQYAVGLAGNILKENK